MINYSDRELKYARPVAGALLENSSFRRWLLTGTKFGPTILAARPVGEIQGARRSPGLKNPYWFNYWCGKDSRCTCRIGTGIETDILLIFDCPNDRRLALHIEVKRPGDRLGDGQAESYPRRAACWADPSTRPRPVLPHDDFLTMLVCGRDLKSDRRLKHFDKVIFHDEVAKQISVYPER